MNEKIRSIIEHPRALPVAVGVVAFASGATAGFFLGRRQSFGSHSVPVRLLESDEPSDRLSPGRVIIDEEALEAIRERDEALSRGESFVAEHIATEPEPEPEEDENVIPPVVAQNVFAMDDAWNLEEEIKRRSREVPYVIHKDEFFSEESGLSQSTLTYYAGDNIMVDEDTKPVYNYETVVGELKFGHGSGDPKTFYVRNEKMMGEYEVVHDEGQYSVEVLGLEIEDNERARDLRHSQSPGKFRAD